MLNRWKAAEKSKMEENRENEINEHWKDEPSASIFHIAR